MTKAKIKITNPELAILSLVAEQPAHGYQIEQLIEERGMREWTEIGFSSIYYILNKLERQGWIKSQIQNAPRQGPARRVFRATPTGKKVCQQASLEAMSNPRPSSSHFLLGLANLPSLDASLVSVALKQYQASLTDKLCQLTAKRDGYGAAIPLHVRAMFDHSLQLIQAELTWLQSFIKQKENE